MNNMKNVFDVLKQIKTNNNKDWFDANKEKYLLAKDEFEKYTDEIINGIRKFDKKIDPGITAKKCTFRIYKDVRFSKDKTPYKTNMGASINPGGKKSQIAGYYFHCEPGNSFLAGGVYMPMPDVLQAIRQEIDYHPKEFKKIMSSPSFKKYFDGLDEIEKLKTVPKGFDKENEMIEILKHKHFIVTHELKDKDLLDSKKIAYIIEGFKSMKPFIDYLRAAQGE